jgi:hypothetical protein
LLFGKDVGVVQLQKLFEQSKDKMKTTPVRSVLKNTIKLAIHTTSNEAEFKKQLTEQGINTIIRRNNKGRIYVLPLLNTKAEVFGSAHSWTKTCRQICLMIGGTIETNPNRKHMTIPLPKQMNWTICQKKTFQVYLEGLFTKLRFGIIQLVTRCTRRR